MTTEIQQFQPSSELAPVQAGGDMIAVAGQRAAAEVQAAMVIAQKCPRDEVNSHNRIMKACSRPRLAESAFYSYSKGGTKIFGASVHLLRMMAAQWGNCESGWTIMSQSDEESVVQAFCWDWQTNHKSSITFTVRHEMKAYGKIKKLDDPRDIYEHIANQAARRQRKCIESIIPPDIQDEAIDMCQKTLRGQSDEPLIDRVKKMVLAFDKFSVSQEMIETKLQHKIEATDEAEFVRLRGIYTSLNDNASAREDHFKVAPEASTDPSDLTPGKKSTAAAPAAPTPSPDEPPAPAETTAEESRDEQSTFFGNDLDQNKPCTDEQAEQIKDALNARLKEAGHGSNATNRNKLVGFAMMGSDISLKNPLVKDIPIILEKVNALNIDEVNECITTP